MLFAAVHESAFGTSLRSLRRNILSAFGPKRTTADFGPRWFVRF
jgi:hypothetical protein